MLFRASLLALIVGVGVGEVGLAQDLPQHRFVVYIGEEGASLSISPVSDLASQEFTPPTEGIRIVCSAANMSTLENGRVVIECKEGTFASAKGLTGEAEQVVCDVTGKVITFQNGNGEQIELKLAGAEGEKFSLVGLSISLDLQSNQFRAHRAPLQLGYGQLESPPLADQRPQLNRGPAPRSGHGAPGFAAPSLSPPANQIGPSPNALPSLGTPPPPRARNPQQLPSNSPPANIPSLGDPSPSSQPRPSLGSDIPQASDSTRQEDFSFFLGLTR